MKAANETSFEPIGDLDLVLLSAEQIRTDPGIFNAMLRVVQADYVKPSFVFEREMKKASHAHVCIVGQRLVGFCLFEQGYLGGGLRCTYVGLTVISPEFRGRG